MRQLSIITLVLLSGISCFGQAPLVSRPTWAARAGASFNFPLIGEYTDFSLVKGADYFWDYTAKPLAGLGYYAEVAMVKPLRQTKNNAFVTYGIGYRQVVRGLQYSGWEGGGSSGVVNRGNGTMRWTDHYAAVSGKITHQFSVGLKRRIVLNSLGLTAGFKVYEQEDRDYEGQSSYTNGSIRINALGYTTQKINDEFYIPQLHLNYEFGYVLPLRKGVLIPQLVIPVLNFNNFIQKYEPRNTPLKVRKEYYKEIMIGIAFMPVVVK